MRERSPRPCATPRGDNSAPTTGPKPAARRERLRRRPRREAAPVPTAPPPSGGSANGGAGGSPCGAREAPTSVPAPVPTAPQPSGGSANGGAGGSPRGSSGATDDVRATEFRRAKRDAFCVFCGLNSNAAALAGHSFTHFETITEKNIKKQPRHPKEITPIKSYQKYAYFAFPHAHVPYIIGEPPQNLV